ncbi:MAG: hypothetical protein NTY77_05905 [Elusimicrobia bacterium]|nr:hypothetical protein [Elusimicrobiota bacterium]
MALFITAGQLAQAAPSEKAEPQSSHIYSCVGSHSTSIACKPGKPCVAEASKDPSTMKIIGPESDEPMMIGNMGNSPLLPYASDDGGVILLEKSDLGNVIFWRWLKESKRLFQVKAYNLLGIDYSVTVLYECKRVTAK